MSLQILSSKAFPLIDKKTAKTILAVFYKVEEAVGGRTSAKEREKD